MIEKREEFATWKEGRTWPTTDQFKLVAGFVKNECEAAWHAGRKSALSAPQPSSEQWKSWTEHPAMVKEPAVYPVLVDDGSGSLETDNNLTLSFAEWRPELQRSGHSNYADKWGCGWSKSHIRYWFPLELGASLNKLNALPQPSGKGEE